jgi:mevalonate kinase
MSAASAPGKVILLGEHAVVFGRPAVALAIDLRLRCSIRPSMTPMLNGQPMDERAGPYLAAILREHCPEGPVAINIVSDLPSGSGLGSSAAVTVAALGAISAFRGGISPETIARQAFDVESTVQGRASPIDTSVSSHGGGIFISSERGERLLWEISRDTRRWFIHDCEVPRMTLVVGFTGNKAPTGPLVAKVRRYADRSGFAREIIDEIGTLTLEGMARMKARDLEALGRLMTRDHKLLTILGVSTPALQKLVDASLPHSYGAKLTGAGGGGSMIALTDEPIKVADAIKARGGIPYIVCTGVEGVRGEAVTERSMS